MNVVKKLQSQVDREVFAFIRKYQNTERPARTVGLYSVAWLNSLMRLFDAKKIKVRNSHYVIAKNNPKK